MIKALFTSATGMNAQQLAVDNTANNLANLNTTAFKRNSMNFQDLLYITQKPAGTQATQNLQVPSGIQIGSGVKVSGNSKFFQEGAITQTGNPLNIAINGDGFFQVQLPNSEVAYTRDGSLQMNSTGQLVTADGYLVQPQITFPQDTQRISIGIDGTVSVITASSPNTSSNLGTLQLTRFPNPAGLSAEGGNLYTATAASGAAVVANPGLTGTGFLQQGFLEGSNVDVVAELVNLITAQRAYEFNTRVVQSVDQMLSDTTNLAR